MKLMYFISVIKTIHSMKTSFHTGAKGHTQSSEPPCRGLTLSAGRCSMQKPKDPNWGLHKADSDRALTPPSAEDRNHRRGGEPRSARGPGRWAPGTPTGRGQQRGKRGKAVGSSRAPGAGTPSRREGAECRGATQRHGEVGSHLRRSLCGSDPGSGTVRVSYNLNKEGSMSGAKLNNTCGFDVIFK